MALTTMYPPMTNSPVMYLSGALTASGTEATVTDASAYASATLPLPLTIGISEGAETVLCTAISGNVLTLQRGLEGTAASWEAGTAISRNFCALDHTALETNIRALDAAKAEKTELEGHTSDSGIHVTAAQKTEWDGKAPGAHASQHRTGGSDPLTPSDIGAETAGAAAAVQEVLEGHASNSDIHVTAAQKTEWSGKADGSHCDQHNIGGVDEITRLNLDEYNEYVADLTGTVIDFDAAPVLSISLSGDMVFDSIDGTPADGYARSGILLLATGTTAPTVTFPADIAWAADVEIAASSIHELVFRKYPGFEKWIASCAATIALE